MQRGNEKETLQAPVVHPSFQKRPLCLPLPIYSFPHDIQPILGMALDLSLCFLSVVVFCLLRFGKRMSIAGLDRFKMCV